MSILKPYTGLISKLVIALDIGTTYSGVSYCILEPGRIPETLGVTRFPDLRSNTDDVKVPSLLYYDPQGNLKAAGAEVLSKSIIELALIEGWTKAEWWKLHLRPRHLAISHEPDKLHPLPPGKSAVDILTDFIKYLFVCTKTYIQEHHRTLSWSAIEDSIEYVFTHPNGWEGLQQQLYRQAVERAGLVPATHEGRSRVYMLTDGEASLHFFVSKFPQKRIPGLSSPRGIVIIDAGGGTIDSSMFSMVGDPVSCKEIAPAECQLQGSAFVTCRAAALLKERLEGWEYSAEEEMAEYTTEFDHSTIYAIKSEHEPVYIRVASYHYHDPKYDILSGRLRLSSAEAAGLLSDSYNAITSAFERQLDSVTIPITAAFLVGKFSTNGWLWGQLQSYFTSKNITICRLDRHIEKAVPNGAALSQVLSHVDHKNHLVTARVARATYGVVCSLSVDDKDEQHIQRKDQWEIDPTGARYVPGRFEVKVFKGAQVPKEMEFQDSFSLTERDPKDFMIQKVRLVCYQGKLSNPKWVDQDESSFFTFCTIYVDLSVAARDLFVKKAIGRAYYKLEYRVIVLFGLPELQAYLAWKTEKGERRIPAKISYD